MYLWLFLFYFIKAHMLICECSLMSFCFFGFFLEGLYFGKAVQKKIQQNVAVKRENQTLSIKKIQINQLAQKKGGGQEWEEKSQTVRQTVGLQGKGISLSTLQRKTGWLQGWSEGGSLGFS